MKSLELGFVMAQGWAVGPRRLLNVLVFLTSCCAFATHAEQFDRGKSLTERIVAETRFAYIPTANLNDMDLQWLGSLERFPTGSLVQMNNLSFEMSAVSSNQIFVPTIAGVLKQPALRDVMIILDANPDVELFFAPTMTTNSGSTFDVNMVRLTEEIREINADGSPQGAFTVKRIMQLTPEFSASGDSRINLKMTLPVIEYVGKGHVADLASRSPSGANNHVKNDADSQSLFEIRNSKVSVEIGNGETVLFFGSLLPHSDVEKCSQQPALDDRSDFGKIVRLSNKMPSECVIVFVTTRSESVQPTE